MKEVGEGRGRRKGEEEEGEGRGRRKREEEEGDVEIVIITYRTGDTYPGLSSVFRTVQVLVPPEEAIAPRGGARMMWDGEGKECQVRGPKSPAGPLPLLLLLCLHHQTTGDKGGQPVH